MIALWTSIEFIIGWMDEVFSLSVAYEKKR